MKNPSGTERGRFVIQGSALSFKGCAHPLENASEANQCLLTIRVNCSEDGLTSAPRPGGPLRWRFRVRIVLRPCPHRSHLATFALSNKILS